MKTIQVRVYGIWVNAKKEVLISDERHRDMNFTKFPGGGLELGESVTQALLREFQEECDIHIIRFELLHVTEEVVISQFDGSQVVGIYYRVFSDDTLCKPIKTKLFDFEHGSDQSFRWVPVNQLSADDFTFKMDQTAWKRIQVALFSQ